MGKLVKFRKSGSSRIMTVPKDIADMFSLNDGSQVELEAMGTDSFRVKAKEVKPNLFSPFYSVLNPSSLKHSHLLRLTSVIAHNNCKIKFYVYIQTRKFQTQEICKIRGFSNCKSIKLCNAFIIRGNKRTCTSILIN